MTKIIVEPRRSGKSTKAILESVKTGYPILVPTFGMKKSVKSTAVKYGLENELPEPLSLGDWERGNTWNGNEGIDGVIVDEALILLENILGTKVKMLTMSERENEYVVKLGKLYFRKEGIDEDEPVVMDMRFSVTQEYATTFQEESEAKQVAERIGGTVERIK
jgi:hypothetical protein